MIRIFSFISLYYFFILLLCLTPAMKTRFPTRDSMSKDQLYFSHLISKVFKEHTQE